MSAAALRWFRHRAEALPREALPYGARELQRLQARHLQQSLFLACLAGLSVALLLAALSPAWRQASSVEKPPEPPGTVVDFHPPLSAPLPPPRLEGKRLYLRPIKDADVGPRYLGWMRDRNVVRIAEAIRKMTSLPASNVGEFIKLIKANPGKFKFASSGVGASPHLTMELFKAVTGIDLIHVPYKTAGQGYTDTITGEIQAFFFNLPGPLSFVKAGRLRALAVTSAKRAEQLPDVPTLMESGVPDFEVTVWQGYAMPKGTSKAHVASVHAAMMKVLASPDLKQRFFDNGVAAAPTTPDEFVKFIGTENAKWKKAVALAGAKVE